MPRMSTAKCVLLCVTVVIIYTTQLIFQCDVNSRKHDEKERSVGVLTKNNVNDDIKQHKSSEAERFEDEKSDWHPHKLAVIVPFRNRFEELMEFVPWIHKFLNNQKVPHQIIVVNQIDTHRFNRASLINIGFLKSNEECDYMVMHDVDLLPNNPDLKYTYPEKGPHHLASPEYHPMYHYKTYIGGVLMMTNEHFKLCRGMSNIFWGWGREDDELYLRFKENQLKLYRPSGLTTGYQTFKHIHDKVKRPRDYKRYGAQKKTQFKKDKITGFDTLQYKVESERTLTIDDAPVKIYNVELHCNLSETPWCDHEQ